MSNVIEIVKNLANREAKRTEADIQAGIRDLLLQAALDLDDEDLDVKLESQLGDRRRIDVEVGSVVIEVKKDGSSLPFMLNQHTRCQDNILLTQKFRKFLKP
jgi:formylmethanofuran dehydrogenase subunit D